MKDQETWDDRYQLLNQPYLRWGLVTTGTNFAAGVDSRAAVIICTAGITVTLPLAADAANHVYVIKNATNPTAGVTITPNVADTIDTVAGPQVLLPDQFDVIWLMSDGGTNWWILSFTNL